MTTCYVTEAARLLRVSPSTARKLCASGRMVAVLERAGNTCQWIVTLGPNGMPITRDWRKGRPGRPPKGERR